LLVLQRRDRQLETRRTESIDNKGGKVMTYALAAFLIGIVAGLRAMTAPAIASWSAAQAWIGPVHGWPAFMGYRWTPWIFTIAALGEWVTDQLPSTPSRKVPVQFAARVIMGALAGATFGAIDGSWIVGLLLGAVGAVVGTLGGASGRGMLAERFGRDRPAALLEDALAVAIGIVATALV
jgi:uncharacterized membrane protein